MDYRELAGELVDAKQQAKSMVVERNVNKAIEGRPYVLKHLYEYDGEAYPKDLCEDMGVSTARIATILNQLEDRGYITREDDPDDSRQVVVKITDEGVDKAREMHNELLDYFANLLKKLGPEDAREYVRLQHKVLAIMANMPDSIEMGAKR